MVNATGDQLSGVKKRTLDDAKPRAITNVKLRDVAITVLPGSGSREADEEVNPLKPCRRLPRSPTTAGRKDSCDGGDSEVSVTPVEKTDRGEKYLARKAVEMSSSTGYDKKSLGGNEIGEESDSPLSDNGKDVRYYLTGYEMNSLTKTLTAVVKAFRIIAKGLGRNRRENVDLRKMSDMVEGSVCTLEQCMGAPGRRVSTKPGHGKVGETGRIIDRTVARKQEKAKVDPFRKPVAEQPKRKIVSHAEGSRNAAGSKRPRRVELTYAEICGGAKVAEDFERERSDSDVWRVVEKRKKGEKRRGPPDPITTSAKGSGRDGGGAGRRILPGRRRREAILIKVEEGHEWMEIYRRLMAVRSTIVGTTDTRKTRAGHILIELDRDVAVNEVAEWLKVALSDQMEVSALVEGVTIQVKNIDPLTDKEELVEDIRRDWKISSADRVEVKALRMASWGTQMAVLVMPASAVPSGEEALKVRTGLTIASVRILSNAQRCYKCHMLGHTAARYKVACPGRELCRKCGSADHIMKDCTKEPRCAMCSKYEGESARHITGSVACPVVRSAGMREDRKSASGRSRSCK